MSSLFNMHFRSAVALSVIIICGCTIDSSRRASRMTGIADVNETYSKARSLLNEPPVIIRRASQSESATDHTQLKDASRGETRSSVKSAPGPTQDLSQRRNTISAPSLHRRRTELNPAVTVVSHSEPSNPVVTSTQIATQSQESTSSSGTMTLAQFEELALQNNPTIGQASADINKANAIRDQVGRYPNPVLGYFGSQIADAGTDQHGVFFEQEIVRGGKLPINQQIMRHAIAARTAEAESQAFRVLTDVRTRFIVALAAQMEVKLTREFEVVATQGVEIATRRKAAQEGSQPELLQAQIQLNEIELMQQQAHVAFTSAFRDLAAVTGTADLEPAKLVGELSNTPQLFEWEYVYAELLASSPELQTAQAKLQQAGAQLQRERIQAIPNPTLQLGGGIDNGTGSGLLNVQVSAPFPIYNSNRGNICAAQADYDKASQEITRIELAIKSRLANVSREYDSAQAAVQKYESEILPKSKESLELTESLYRAGEIDFLQTFQVRKTYFESNLRYIQALSGMAQARARIDGLLLEGGLDSVNALEGDDSNRERVFSQK